MNLLGVEELRSERLAFLATIRSLRDDEFERGRTLCADWTPRDVLAHLVGTNELHQYALRGLRVNAVNAMLVERRRGLSRAQLTATGEQWAAHPTVAHRMTARFLIGDVCMHHQDVLRGLGRPHDVPDFVAAAILREGAILSTGTRRNLLHYRVVPTTPGVRPLGRGIEVHGTAEALGLWLAGRRGIEPELEFEGSLAGVGLR